VRALLLALAALLACASAARAAIVPTLGNWSRDEQEMVVSEGLLTDLDDGAFHGERALTHSQLQVARDALAVRLGAVPAPIAGDVDRISVAAFDALLVAQLGLADTAAAVQAEAARAGLAPPPRFGSEVVARLLGLRFNHPFPLGERLELYPWEAITRAEAAWSLARAAELTAPEVEWARETLASFVLPDYTPGERQALRIAVSKIGMPYIWGGETDTRSAYFGGQAHGGYDCSGFVWRVFKLSGLPAGRQIHGRTAAQQAGEILRARRIALDDVRPADLLFFGHAKIWQRATEARIVHEGIALSADWAINSSSQGVYVLPLTDGRLYDDFAWARRVL
jgi:cell wall-associated NlpC family hydrolase